jgi:hypothetical protein
MLAVNFHLMGGMPVRPASEPSAPVAEPSRTVAGGTRATLVHGPDAPAEVVVRRPIALQLLLSKVRENFV